MKTERQYSGRDYTALRLLLLTLCFAWCALLASVVQAQSQSPSPNQVGFWWKPSESGWGLSIQQQGTRTFAVWYTYGTSSVPTWYTLDCAFAGTTCTGTLFTGTGTPFAQLTGGANPTAVNAGTGTLTLTASNRMSLSYTIGTVTQTKADLEPFNFVTTGVPTCTLQPGSRAGVGNYTDLYWGGAAASGWGIQISHQARTVFLGWYGYNDARNASWLTGVGEQDASTPTKLRGKLYRSPSGTPFAQINGPNTVPAEEVGTFEINFTDGERGSITFSLPGSGVTNRVLPLERFAIAGGNMNVCVVAPPQSAKLIDASRFVSQATFGGTMAEIEALANSDYTNWLNTQFARPQTLHLPNVVAWLATRPADMQNGQAGFQWSIWKNFATADDSLRQRMAYNLSQIFVISLNSNLSAPFPRGPANYLDLLGKHAFGNFRDLIEEVTYSPMMGIYLSHLRNTKENPATGSVPDENYAREVMQLFTIGLYELNLDGTVKTDAGGKPIETYTNSDVTGLAKVLTGLSWGGPDASDARYNNNAAVRDADREILRMQAYDKFHSLSEKKFLGVTIPAAANAAGTTNADLKIALDRLFNHPNVGPFIGKQLIQRMVSANPSLAYVARVAGAFNNNGAGVRGDMKAVIRAILLDPEARNANSSSTTDGKLREPVVRMVQWMRAFSVKSNDGRFLLGSVSDPAQQLAQTPMYSPSVFNFYRPGFSPPNSKVGSANLVSPEAQIINETSVAGYLNYMRAAIQQGLGTTINGARDIQPNYAAELQLVNDPVALVDRMNVLLAGGRLSSATKNIIVDAIASINPSTDAAKLNRVYTAIYLTMAAPEYILQN
jgi:uncharacterized protein (DUF1800 family)